MKGESHSEKSDRQDAKRNEKKQRKTKKQLEGKEPAYTNLGENLDDKTQGRSPQKPPPKKQNEKSSKSKSKNTSSTSSTNYDTDTSFKKVKSKAPKPNKIPTSPSKSSRSERSSKSTKSERSAKSDKKKKSLNEPELNVAPAPPRKRLAKMENSTKTGYLGVITRHDAEVLLGSKSNFALYHDLGFSPILSNMGKEIQLCAVHRSSRGSYSHFLIREQNYDDLTKEYFVDTGRSNLPKTFKSIEKLMQNYCQSYN